MSRLWLVIALALVVSQLQAQPKPPASKSKTPSKAGFKAAPLLRETIDRHRQFMLANVGDISTPGIPGPIVVYGPNAFPVVVDQRDGQSTVFVAAALWGKGRLVALPHNGYLGTLLREHAGSGVLARNCLLWAASCESQGISGLRVGVHQNPEILQQLHDGNMAASALPDSGWTGHLEGLNVLIADLNNTTPEERQHLERFVRQGGGILSANLIWGWQQQHPGANPLTENGANLLYSRAGIVWADGYNRASYGALVKVDQPLTDYYHVSWALDALDEAAAKKRILQPEDGAALASTFRNLGMIPRVSAPEIFARVEEYLQKYTRAAIVPTAKTPISRKDPAARLFVSMQTAWFQDLLMDQLKPHPAASKFPGSVPKAASRSSRKLELDLTQHGWKSTGLYAAPGEVVTIHLDPSALKRGYSAQIGCHTDLIWDSDEWKRTPQMTRQFPLSRPTQTIGHALGGPIYIVIPSSLNGEKLALEIAGAVEAPHYVLGRTSLADWRNTVRNRAAPWAELECNRLIISVPSTLVRELDDPEALMQHWVKVLDACADLRGIPHERPRPERFVFDQQISLGFLHSGYPIMAHIDPTAPEVVDLRHLTTRGGWGFYHELGHNHQLPEWTFDGTGEVTCNWFSLYVHETLTPKSYTHEAVQQAAKDRLERAYIAGGAQFEKWKSDPFLALIMYQQLREGFGWEAYQKVLAEYRDLPGDQRPGTDQDKHDQWMVRFSRTVGKNLGPFFQYWGIPTTEAARKSIENLPTWMPAGRPLQ